METVIAGGLGVVISLVTVYGGVSAVEGKPDGVPQSALYNYADE